METAKSLLMEEPSESLWLPYLPGTLDAGSGDAVRRGAIEALGYLEGE